MWSSSWSGKGTALEVHGGSQGGRRGAGVRSHASRWRGLCGDFDSVNAFGALSPIVVGRVAEMILVAPRGRAGKSQHVEEVRLPNGIGSMSILSKLARYPDQIRERRTVPVSGMQPHLVGAPAGRDRAQEAGRWRQAAAGRQAAGVRGHRTAATPPQRCRRSKRGRQSLHTSHLGLIDNPSRSCISHFS